MLNLTSKTINELCTGENGEQFRFHIPTYQRGYRWEEHVDTLLDDLYEYKTAKDARQNVGDFYCLQPIVVMRDPSLDDRGVGYEIIDGQQRLTTIFILLKAFNYEDWYLVTYQRDGQEENERERERFLYDVATASAKTDKADYFYIKRAYDRVVNWVDNKKTETGKNPKQGMLSVLLDEVRVIWYELPQGTNAREVFRHINDGKIQLTSSELIKAMLLNQKHYKIGGADEDTQNIIVRNKQERIARMWDEIERTLQTPDFWAFIYSKPEKLSTRIDYIFELIYQKNNPQCKETDHERLCKLVFEYFEKRLVNSNNVDALWDEVRQLHRTFQDWYASAPLYNYIGFLVQYKIKSLLEIIKMSDKLTNTEFINWLCGLIKNHLDIEKDSFEQISYSTEITNSAGRKKIEKLLMLFNIEIMNQMNKHFDFNVDGGWSVEHVFACNSIKIPENKRGEWLEGYMRVVNSAIRHIDDKERLADLQELKDRLKMRENHEFEMLFNDVINTVEIGMGSIETDNISNLALIGKDDNSALNNSAFYEKREKIIKFLEQGRNIPQGTTNVFMKFYSSVGTNLDYWSEEDGTAYLKRMKKLLEKYFIGGGDA